MTVLVSHVMRTYGVHGGERQLAQLFSSFAEPGYRHDFFYVYRDQKCDEYFSAIPGLGRQDLIPLDAKQFPRLLTELLVLVVLLPILWGSLYFRLIRSGSRIVVAHGMQAGLVAWLSAVFLPGRKFIYVHRGTKSTHGRHPIFKLIYWPFDVVAGVSGASRDSLTGLAPDRKLLVLENGIDLSRYAFPTEKRPAEALILTSVGRLISAKGQAFLLQAFARIQARIPHAELHLAGDGPDETVLKELAESLGIADRVRFLGHQQNVASLLASTDIFVFASESEGLSNSVLEAMAMGVPSVVVDAPGVSECHVDGETGFVTPRDADSFAERVLMLANSPDLRLRLGRAARARVESQYSIEANWRRYAALYASLLGPGLAGD